MELFFCGTDLAHLNIRYLYRSPNRPFSWCHMGTDPFYLCAFSEQPIYGYGLHDLPLPPIDIELLLQ